MRLARQRGRLAGLEGEPQRGEARRRVADPDVDQFGQQARPVGIAGAQLGACAVAATCRELEYLGRDGTLAGVEERLARLQQEFENARNALLALKQG